MYKIEFQKSAYRAYIKLPSQVRNKLYNKLLTLAKNPFNNNLDIKKLVGIENCYRIRVGDYRAVYKLHNDILIIEIIKVAHRREVYQ
jgi:mRNA interferase RelE/StbE